MEGLSLNDSAADSEAIAAFEAEIDQRRQAEIQQEVNRIQDVAFDTLLRSNDQDDPEDLPSFETRMQQAAEKADAAAGTTKKKKKKSKGAKKKIKNLGEDATGFEDFFADVPQRPEDAALELELYAPSKSAAMRLETCVQRYRVARKLDSSPWRKEVFDAYLSLGGVQTGQKEYGGADHNAPMDPEERKQMTAVDFVDEDDDRKVDFVFLARAFFSYRCVAAAGQSSLARVQEGPEVIINFLKYVNRHDVLPEYRDQINAAIAFAEHAKVELTANKKFSLDAPGDLNSALSVLYGGYYRRVASTDSWNPGYQSTTPMIDESKATEIVSKQFPELKSKEHKIIKTAIGLPVEVVRKEVRNDQTSYLHLKLWANVPGAPDEDQVTTDLVELTVVIENDIAEHVFEQMHIEATFHQFTEDGLWFFEFITRVLPSYYIDVGTDASDDGQ